MGSNNLLPPWRDVLPDGSLGEEYGPKTLATYQSQCTKSSDWAFRSQRTERPEAKVVHQYVREHHADIADSQLDVYRTIYVLGMSLNEAAEDSGLHRSTIVTYRKRLRERAEGWKKGK